MKTTIIILGIILTLTSTLVASEKETNKQAEAALLTSSLAGVVMDKLTGEPLTGVEICITGTSLKAYTDFDGKYSFANLTPGEYTISASLISYKSNGSQQIEVNNGKVHSLNLELETVRR